MTPVRIQRRRSKGWKMPAGAVFVGRPTVWGNPFTVEQFGLEWALIFFERMLLDARPSGLSEAAWCALALYRETVLHEHPGFPHVCLAAVRRELRGKPLACWCPTTQPCHADILLRLANSEPSIFEASP